MNLSAEGTSLFLRPSSPPGKGVLSLGRRTGEDGKMHGARDPDVHHASPDRGSFARRRVVHRNPAGGGARILAVRSGEVRSGASNKPTTRDHGRLFMFNFGAAPSLPSTERGAFLEFVR